MKHAADDERRDAAEGRARRGADRVATIFAAALMLVLACVLGRVIQLQTAPGARLAAHIAGRTVTLGEEGPRGDLLDRRGRLLAGTRYGARAFVDPTLFPSPPDAALVALADAAGLPVEEVAERIVPRMAENERRGGAMAAGGNEGSPIRYVSIGGVLEDWRAEAVRGLGVPGVYLETRSVRVTAADDLAASLVGVVGIDHDGLLGAELMVDGRLRPGEGTLRYVRDAFNRPLWIEPGGFDPAPRGEDVRLSIDLELQRIAIEELTAGIESANAAGGRLVMADPMTGEVLAIVDLIRDLPGLAEFEWSQAANPPRRRYRTIRPDPGREDLPALGRNRCVEDVYEPGSTFKPYVWSVATALGIAKPEEVIPIGRSWRTPYGRYLEDVHRADEMTWAEVLIHSSNIGMAKIAERMTHEQARSAAVRFGFGSKTDVGLPGESPGIVTTAKNWTKYSQTSVAMGHEIAVTPVQMVRAFSAFARTGEAAGTLPRLRLTAVDAHSAAQEVQVRVLPAESAEIARETMRGVAKNLDRKLARGVDAITDSRYEMFGKSGTAEIPLGAPPKGTRRPRGADGYYKDQYNSSFIAAAPAERPRIVVLVVIDDPGPERVAERKHYGSTVAGPVVRRVMERALTYLGEPPDRDGIREEDRRAEAR